ncbi:hypothetical protein Tco_0864866 [Tanacetum coccineum]
MDSKLTRTIKIKEMRVESLVGLINGKWLLQVCYNSYNESKRENNKFYTHKKRNYQLFIDKESKKKARKVVRSTANGGDAGRRRTVAMQVDTNSGDAGRWRTVAMQVDGEQWRCRLMANGGDKVDGGRARTGGDMVRKLKVWEWEG